MKKRVLFLAVTMSAIFAFTTNNAMAQSGEYMDIEKNSMIEDRFKEEGQFDENFGIVSSSEEFAKVQGKRKNSVSPEEIAKVKTESLAKEITLDQEQIDQVYEIYLGIAKRNISAMNEKRDNYRIKREQMVFENEEVEEVGLETESTYFRTTDVIL